MTATPSYFPRPELSLLASEFDRTANRLGFIGLGIMPIFNTMEKSGKFPALDAKALLTKANDKRSNLGGYSRIGFQYVEDDYTCKEYGLEHAVDHAFAKQYASYLDAEVQGALQILEVLARNDEIRTQAIVLAQTGTSVTNAWSNASTGTPRANVIARAQAIQLQTGVMPNAMQITWDQLQWILRCDEFLGVTKLTSNPFDMGLDAQINLLKTYFGLEKLLVANAVTDGGDEGDAFAPERIWDNDNAFLFITKGGLESGPQFGLTMQWQEDSMDGTTESYEEAQTRATVLRTRHHRDKKIVLATAGSRLTDIE